MNYLQFARIIASICMFLEVNEDQVIDADDAVKMREYLMYLIGELENDTQLKLTTALDQVADEWPEEFRELVRGIHDDFDLDENEVSQSSEQSVGQVFT